MSLNRPLRTPDASPRSETRFPHAHEALRLVPQQQRRVHSALGIWHLLSLDAPTVAALWTWFVAQCTHVDLPWTSPAAMFVAVWMVYAADRLFDAQPFGYSARADHLEMRHRFHRKHQPAFIAAMGVAVVSLALLLRQLHSAELRLFAALGSLLFAYFFLIHLWPALDNSGIVRHTRLPKEFAVGVFFSAAVFIPTVARVPASSEALWPLAICFAVVCTLNCLYVYAWEHPYSRADTHWTTRYATRHLIPITLICGVGVPAAMVARCIGRAVQFSSLWGIALSCTVSSLLFLCLHRYRRSFRPVTLRACVDLALLTPLLFVSLIHRSQA